MTTLGLVGGQTLAVEHQGERDLVHIRSLDGEVRVTVVVSAAGAMIRLEGAGLVVSAAGALVIDAEHVSIHSREGIELCSQGNTRIVAQGDLELDARSQLITAQLGDVAVRANDDVRLNGEHIRLNC